MDLTVAPSEERSPRKTVAPGSPGSPRKSAVARDKAVPPVVLDVSLRTVEPQEPLFLEENKRIPSLHHHSFSMDELELGLADSPFFFVPSEITLEILRNLPVADLKSAFLVCRLWAVERSNELLWKTVVFKRYAEFAQLKPSGMSWRALAVALSNEIKPAETPDPSAPRQLGRVKFPAVQGEFVGYLVGGLPCGLGLMVHDQGNTYSGQFLDGKKHGTGEFRWKNGNTYVGDWREDKQTGQGEFKWNDGDYYKGEWKDDHRHGKGIYTWPKGSYYEGEFHMNDLHNHGRYTWKSGYYEGGWKNSTRHGKGTIRWTNGNKFEGEFVNNAKSGFGVYRWSDGATYSGSWEADDRSGDAVTAWANGMSYTGRYGRDLRNGEGVLRWPNNDTFEGVWRNGGRFGEGWFTSAGTGERVRQVWKEDEKIQYSKGIPARYPGESK